MKPTIWIVIEPSLPVDAGVFASWDWENPVRDTWGCEADRGQLCPCCCKLFTAVACFGARCTVHHRIKQTITRLLKRVVWAENRLSEWHVLSSPMLNVSNIPPLGTRRPPSRLPGCSRAVAAERTSCLGTLASPSDMSYRCWLLSSQRTNCDMVTPPLEADFYFCRLGGINYCSSESEIDVHVDFHNEYSHLEIRY